MDRSDMPENMTPEALHTWTMDQLDEMAREVQRIDRSSDILVNIEAVRLALGNKQLAEIASALEENAEQLKIGQKAVKTARENFETTQKVLEAIGAFVSIAARIVGLVL